MTPYLTCPACEAGELRPGPFVVRCFGCGYAFGRDFFGTLRAIRALPESPAEHGCRRCGHPETRRLPGEAGASWCPACGAETSGREGGQGRRAVWPGEEG